MDKLVPQIRNGKTFNQVLVELAVKELGVKEWKDGFNPVVKKYYEESGHPQIKDDSVAWCAAFLGAMVRRAGGLGTKSLLARSYVTWGKKIATNAIQPGDVGVVKRGTSTWQGHVFIITRATTEFVTVIGGNQKDSVGYLNFKISELIAVRRGEFDERPVKTVYGSPAAVPITIPTFSPIKAPDPIVFVTPAPPLVLKPKPEPVKVPQPEPVSVPQYNWLAKLIRALMAVFSRR